MPQLAQINELMGSRATELRVNPPPAFLLEIHTVGIHGTKGLPLLLLPLLPSAGRIRCFKHEQRFGGLTLDIMFF